MEGNGLTAPRRGRLPWLALAAILGALASLYCGLHAEINDDDVYHLHSIWLVAHGALPYRDFFEIHPPGLWLLFSPVVLWFHTPSALLLAARCFTAIVFGLIVWLAGRAVRAGAAQAAVLAVLALGTMSYCQVWIFRVEYVAALLFMAHVCLLAGIDPEAPGAGRPLLAAAALALGCSMSVRLLPFLTVQPMLVALCLPRRRWRRQAAAWAGGLLLGMLPTLVYVTVHGLWGEMIFWAFRFVSSSEVVTWSFDVGPAEITLAAFGVAAIALSWRGRLAGPLRRRALILVWLVALVFHLANPHKVDYAAVYLLLATAMLLVAIVPLISDRYGVLRRNGALIAVGVAVVFFGRLIAAISFPADRDVQQMQLRLLDWLRSVAGDEPVVLIAPYHPIMVYDATDLQQAGHYSFWLGTPETQRRLAGFADRLLSHPPPVIAEDPWPAHTGGLDLIDWLRRQGVLLPEKAEALRQMVSRLYDSVSFPSLSREHMQSFGFGNSFWVRRDRLAEHPPPQPARVTGPKAAPAPVRRQTTRARFRIPELANPETRFAPMGGSVEQNLLAWRTGSFAG